MLLADRILLMTNGPYARIAESVTVDLEQPRERGRIIHDPGYYPIRNHLVDFLVRRSKELAGASERAEDEIVELLEVNPAAEARSGAAKRSVAESR